MAGRVHTAPQSGISNKSQTGVMVLATAGSGSDLISVDFKQFMEFTTEEAAGWLERTAFFFWPSSPRVLFISSDLSGNALLRTTGDYSKPLPTAKGQPPGKGHPAYHPSYTNQEIRKPAYYTSKMGRLETSYHDQPTIEFGIASIRTDGGFIVSDLPLQECKPSFRQEINKFCYFFYLWLMRRMEEETQRLLRPRPLSPESSEPIADVIHIHTPAITKPTKPVNRHEHPQTPLQTPFIPATANFNFSPPQIPSQSTEQDKSYPYTFLPGYGEIRTNEQLMDIDVATNLHYHIMIHAAMLLEYLLQKYPITGWSEDEAQQLPGSLDKDLLMHSFINASMMTTNEPISLDDCIQILESKLNRFLDKASYATVLQQNQIMKTCLMPMVTNTVKGAQSIKDTYFIIEVEDPVPENFNALPLQDNLNQLLPEGCSRFTGIRRS
ncbi:hypothetical protein L873DRAFT_1794673 [Choiromyces venosus 120613-1]|uniref:Uncharacterized protein n=1 Tax=Choiromyces venosus 120613-1 TaxID=1336337 RepID=A0A3N4JD79_9PEZI|nr:hypothetical protein L873DRAFT_1794673 [Choiromyces venosus 120613-1]